MGGILGGISLMIQHMGLNLGETERGVPIFWHSSLALLLNS